MLKSSAFLKKLPSKKVAFFISLFFIILEFQFDPFFLLTY